MTARVKKNQVSKPLDAEAWSNAALDLLATHGIDGVRVEPLAKLLSVTKGSFYWHFKDRNALHERMLSDWRRHATFSLIARLDRSVSSPQMRLRKLLRLPMTGEKSQRAADVELAIRLWGRRDDMARLALEEVDQHRLRYIEQLMADCGIAGEECVARAILAYSYIRVAATLIAPEAAAMLAQCERLLTGGSSISLPSKAN